LCTANNTNCFQCSKHTKSGHIGSQFGLVKRHGDKGNSAQVVELVRLHLFKRSHQAGEVRKVARDDFDVRKLVAKQLGARVVLPFHHAKDLVALAMEELGEMTSVLAGNSGDESFAHDR
jgi:hypothetical protein